VTPASKRWWPGWTGEHWRSTSLVQLAAGLVTTLERWYVARGLLDPDLLDEL
jgi:hypothetical protein